MFGENKILISTTNLPLGFLFHMVSILLPVINNGNGNLLFLMSSLTK